LFGTYRAQPRDGHEGMTIGIPGFRDPRRSSTYTGILAIPFVALKDNAAADGAPIARQSKQVT
jgi:hypothetical protein